MSINTITRAPMGGRILAGNKANDKAKPAQISIETNYVAIANLLAAALKAQEARNKEAKDAFDGALISSGRKLLGAVKEVAVSLGAKVSVSQWDEFLKEPVVAAYIAATGNKASANVQAGNMKYVFIGFCHGLEPSETAAGSFIKTRDEFRKELTERKVCEPKKERAEGGGRKPSHEAKGRKKGTPEATALYADNVAAAAALAGDASVTDAVRDIRTRALTLATSAVHWKRFSKHVAAFLVDIDEDEMADELLASVARHVKPIK